MMMKMTTDSTAWNDCQLDLTACVRTLHAEVRQQQRGINQDVLDCLTLYGRRERGHHGCEIAYFDSDTLDIIRRTEPRDLFLLVLKYRKTYAVLDPDDVIVTVGHRIRRVLRKNNFSLKRARYSQLSRQPRHYKYGTGRV